MKKLLVIALFLFLGMSSADAQYGPIRFPSSGSTFTGGTLSSNLIMGGESRLLLGTGTAAVPSIASSRWTTTGFSFPADGYVYFNSSGFTKVAAGSGDAAINLVLFGNYVSTSTWALTLAQSTSAIPCYTFRGDSDTGMGSPSAPGKISLTSDAVECVRVASSGTQIFQYTKLGDAAPALKCKLLTVNTPNATASSSVIAHGLTASKIVSVSATCVYNTDSNVFPSYSNAQLFYEFITDATNVTVITGPSATLVLDKQVKFLIWYTE